MMGKGTLVRSILSSMPIYLLPNTVLLKTCLVKHGHAGGVPLVAWDVVY